MAELWTPNGDGPSAPNIAVAGAKVRYRCVCGAAFYDTGDSHKDDLRYLRHRERCAESKEHIEEMLHIRETEPLRQTDEEWEDWNRRDAERRQDSTVKGTSAWIERERREQRKRSKKKRRR